MISRFSSDFKKTIARALLLLHAAGIVSPAMAAAKTSDAKYLYIPSVKTGKQKPVFTNRVIEPGNESPEGSKTFPGSTIVAGSNNTAREDDDDIGGPSQPEMASFKSIDTDNMVNLFTGDFNYNIPLLDVGGYPVNIFYDAGITMEQEASWVGLGWNINPGSISRNMRGVPDDFNGTDEMEQTQAMKPNITWGVTINGDLEMGGTKDSLPKWLEISAGAGLGFSSNNYLGPAVEFGLKGGVGFAVMQKVMADKNAAADSLALKVRAGFNANISSRNGFTFSPNASLTASAFKKDKSISNGLSLGTSYNSRNGIKALQISDQTTFNKTNSKVYCDGNEEKVKSYGSSQGFTLATSISFAKPSYLPAIRLPLTNETYSGHFQLGGGIWGVYGSGEIEGYKQTAKIEAADMTQKKPMVGYLYYQEAKDNINAVMDFVRLNDNEVTSNTPIISAPQYSYDVFSIQGEGTGGSVRAYRNDMGYVRDNYTHSQDKNFSIGADIGIPGHYGANFNTIKTPSYISEWNNGNKLRTAPGFGFEEAKELKENVYFRNPGETSVLAENQFDRIGGLDLVRFKLGGTGTFPTIEPTLEKFAKNGTPLPAVNLLTAVNPEDRKKRTQVVSFLTASESAEIGLDKDIKSYNTAVLDINNNLSFEAIPRVSEYRKAHHISQVNVTEGNGRRYVYGIPVYNKIQQDFTFSVENPDLSLETVAFPGSEYTGTNSPLIGINSKVDGMVQETVTPAYAHSFLLSGLLSADYVDVTGDGITEDDLGDAAKFNYTRIKQDNKWAVHKWRTPLTNAPNMQANLNAGNLSSTKDDKGIISYGERESWYMHSIESKTMIALFTLSQRLDGKGPLNQYGQVNGTDQSLQKLEKIDLYSKADLKKNGLSKARPIKTVWFDYVYTLCAGTPDNYPSKGAGGKLTLSSIVFTYNGQPKPPTKKDYIFYYTNSAKDNPVYQFNASDRWGTYKPSRMNPAGLKNAFYPYSLQSAKDSADVYAGAWSLKKVLLLSGGQIEVEYESDDYAFVQNRRAADMMRVIGYGNDPLTMLGSLYRSTGLGQIIEHDYIFIEVPDACANKEEVYEKYLKGLNQLAFKLYVWMHKGYEYVNSYATFSDYGRYNNETNKIWIKLNRVDNMSPLSLTALEYLREQLPGQAYEGYDVSDNSGLKQVGEMFKGFLDHLTNAFTDPINVMRSDGKAKATDVTKCFVRLNDPDGVKYGGGLRVKSVKLKDNWAAMTNQYTSVYGQEYDYTTTETFNGKTRVISSGVASYEPSIGGEENPFQTILDVANTLPLGPTSYNAIEMPVLDAFFPAPLVGYSKVTVRALKKNVPAGKKSKSGIGRQVTEFYTARDFPVYYSNTGIDPNSDKQGHGSATTAFLYKSAFDSRALSQGFLVETNDMHGKMRSQSSYAEDDPLTRINYTENFYRNTGALGLEDKFDFIHAAESGVVKAGNMGIDIELMTDTREFSVKSNSMEIQAQLDLFPVFGVFPWLPFIWPVSGTSENTYRAITTTKVINYHAVLDSVLVIDKGSQVSTKNMVFDAQTGGVIVNRTNNEFDQPVYNINYPAYWACSGMGTAYKNIDAVYTGLKFNDGVITNKTATELNKIFESGDELYIKSSAPYGSGCEAKLNSAATIKRLWAFDKKKDVTGLTTMQDLVFMDSLGKLYTRDNVTLRIVRSGKRNMLGEQVQSVTAMADPVRTVNNTRKLILDANSKVVAAAGNAHKEKWQTDNGVIKKLKTVVDNNTCTTYEVEDCNGYLEKSINPYVKGLLGNFRAYNGMVFYDDRLETNAENPATDISKNGYLKNFAPMWVFDANNNLVASMSGNWVWKGYPTRVNARGLELETKDALDIYTAAQYGYNKTMPVAITNNAHYSEMFYESFEDGAFDNSLNKAAKPVCTNDKHIDLVTSLANSRLVNTDAENFTAHTGKNVIAVDANKTATKSFKVAVSEPEYYSLQFGKDTLKNLNDIGGNMNATSYEPVNSNIIATPSFNGAGVSVDVTSIKDAVASNCKVYHYKIITSHYVEFQQNQDYTFKLETPSLIYDLSGGLSTGYQSRTITVNIKRLDETVVKSFIVRTSTSETSITESIYLCKGIYKIESSLQKEYQLCPGFYVCCSSTFDPNDFFQFSCLNYSTSNYKSLSTVNGCSFTTPIPGKDSLLNPVFTVPANKKMLFSAWVREDCGNPATGEPCLSTAYTSNKVEIENAEGGTAILTPTGPIIEGWQRYEGVFTPAAGATQVNLRLINNSSKTIWFDDIRMHPYNANMKSYVYDPVNLRLVAELDANNYASFYEYDEEGTLIRTKAETKEGIKTINETRSSKQKSINSVQ